MYMESPFASANSSVILYLEPYLNSYYNTYQNIITLSSIPKGPLSHLVSTVSSPKLSPFQSPSSSNCLYALLRYPVSSSAHSVKNSDYFMGADDIPAVFSYLQQNGYTVEHSLTKLLFKSNIRIGADPSTPRKMICMIQYSA
jgi:hypothetical protein